MFFSNENLKNLSKNIQNTGKTSFRCDEATKSPGAAVLHHKKA